MLKLLTVLPGRVLRVSGFPRLLALYILSQHRRSGLSLVSILVPVYM